MLDHRFVYEYSCDIETLVAELSKQNIVPYSKEVESEDKNWYEKLEGNTIVTTKKVKEFKGINFIGWSDRVNKK